MNIMRSNLSDDTFQDPSTKKLDKWRSMFHMFNLTTFTVAVISLGVSLLTYAAAPPSPSNVKEYELPMMYYGVNGVFMTVHASFGVLACVKGNLPYLKVYSVIGYVLVLEEVGIGGWMVATLSNRIDAVILEIKNLELSHKDEHDDHRKRTVGNGVISKEVVFPSNRVSLPSNRVSRRDAEDEGDDDHTEEDESAVKGHLIYRDINEYYGCCMYAQKWMAEETPVDEVYEHCLTSKELFCGEKFVLLPGSEDLQQSVLDNCNCEGKVKHVITERIVKQTALLFIALPSQILCLICVAFFIKFEIYTVTGDNTGNIAVSNPFTD